MLSTIRCWWAPKQVLLRRIELLKANLFLEPMSSLYRNNVIFYISKLASESNRTSLEGKKTKPNKEWSVRTGFLFSSVKKKLILIWLFILIQNWTKPKMLSSRSNYSFRGNWIFLAALPSPSRYMWSKFLWFSIDDLFSSFLSFFSSSLVGTCGQKFFDLALTILFHLFFLSSRRFLRMAL